MKINSFFNLILVLFLLSCESQNSKLIVFDPQTISERKITLSEIADQITYIPLDNIIPLGKISGFKISNNAIYASVKDIGIIAFDRGGNLKNTIGSIGRGPGEYLIYMRFCVDLNSGTVYVADARNIVKVYSKTGKFIREFSLYEYGSMIENIEFINNSLFVQYSVNTKDTQFEWIFCDTLGNVIRKRPRHLPPFTTNWGGLSTMYLYNNTINYYSQFGDTVYSVLPDFSEIPSLVIGQGDYRKPNTNLSVEQLISGNYLDIVRIYETHNYFIIAYNFNKKNFLAFIEKDSREFFSISTEHDGPAGLPLKAIENDLDGGFDFFPKDLFEQDGSEYLVGMQNPFQIISHSESDEFKLANPADPQKKLDFSKLAARLNETDNTVLVIVKLKK